MKHLSLSVIVHGLCLAVVFFITIKDGSKPAQSPKNARGSMTSVLEMEVAKLDEAPRSNKNGPVSRPKAAIQSKDIGPSAIETPPSFDFIAYKNSVKPEIESRLRALALRKESLALRNLLKQKYLEIEFTLSQDGNITDAFARALAQSNAQADQSIALELGRVSPAQLSGTQSLTAQSMAITTQRFSIPIVVKQEAAQ